MIILGQFIFYFFFKSIHLSCDLCMCYWIWLMSNVFLH